MSLFPSNPQIGDEFLGKRWNGTVWEIVGSNFVGPQGPQGEAASLVNFLMLMGSWIMPTAYKVLGQLSPAATTEQTLYTVPASTQTVCSTLSVCNRAASSGTFRVRIKINNASDDNKQFVVFDAPIASKDTLLLIFGATLGAGDVVVVYASSADFSFQLFGSEIS
jgi:hypothetical protein